MIQEAMHAASQWLRRVLTRPRDELDRWQKAVRFAYDLGRYGAQQLRQDRPAIVHAWLFTATCYGRIAAWVAGAPRVICAMRNTLDDMRPRQRMVNRWFAARSSAVTVNAEAIRRQMIREAGLPPAKVRTIYNGFDLAGVPAVHANGAGPREWDATPQTKLVAMVARLSPQKDHQTLLQAMVRVVRDVPDLRLLLLGDGPLREPLQRRVEALGLAAHVRFLGERTDVWHVMPQADLVVLSTHYEGCSNAIMEAMAAGRPVVATDVGGNRELIEEGVTGLLVPPADADALAAAMARLLRDPAALQAMGAQGRRRIAERFSMERTVEETDALYRELLTT